MMNKVYVVTSAEPPGDELYETVTASAKEAETFIRRNFPNARKVAFLGNITSFLCKQRNGNNLIMSIHEETIV